MVAELIREAALEGVRDELPHSHRGGGRGDGACARTGPADKPLLDIHANLFVERDSQKGDRDRPQGLAAARGRQRRPDGGIEAMLGTPVYLDLHVKIAKDWQRDPQASCAASASERDPGKS